MRVIERNWDSIEITGEYTWDIKQWAKGGPSSRGMSDREIYSEAQF